MNYQFLDKLDQIRLEKKKSFFKFHFPCFVYYDDRYFLYYDDRLKEYSLDDEAF